MASGCSWTHVAAAARFAFSAYLSLSRHIFRFLGLSFAAYTVRNAATRWMSSSSMRRSPPICCAQPSRVRPEPSLVALALARWRDRIRRGGLIWRKWDGTGAGCPCSGKAGGQSQAGPCRQGDTGPRRNPPTSAPGLGSPLPHLHRDWAHPSHICTGTGLTPPTSAPGLGTPQVEHGAALVEHAILLAGMSPKRKCAEVDMDSDGGKAVPPPHACVRACVRVCARAYAACTPRVCASDGCKPGRFPLATVPRSVACCAGGNEAPRPPECRWYQCGRA